MELSGIMGGGAPVLKRYTVAADVANPGVLVTDGGAGSDGVIPIATTAAVDVVGLTLDSATYVTTQGSTSHAAVTVVINPNAIIAAKLAGGATSGTALTAYAVTTESTDGLSVITTEFDVASPDLVEGMVWGASGANVGVATYITGTASNDATVTMPFPNTIAVGDTFYYSNVSPHRTILAEPTSDFLELNTTTVTTTDAELVVIDMALRESDNSFAYMLADGHMFAGTL